MLISSSTAPVGYNGGSLIGGKVTTSCYDVTRGKHFDVLPSRAFQKGNPS